MSIDIPPAPVQSEPPPLTHKAAKADAKAAHAFAKAQRPWYQKKRYLFSLGFLVLAIVGSASSSGSKPASPVAGSSSTAAPASSAPVQQPAAAPAPAAAPKAAAPSGPTASLPIQNGDWRLDSIRVNDDGIGDFGGTARVTYTGANPEGGGNLFTVTVFVGGSDIAVLNGSADSVQPGRAVTVQLISSDKFVGGPYKYDFQNDL